MCIRDRFIFQQIPHLFRCTDTVHKRYGHNSPEVIVKCNAQGGNPAIRQAFIMRQIADILNPIGNLKIPE